MPVNEIIILRCLSPIIDNYNRAIGLMSRVFTNGSGGWGSIPKTQKMVLDAVLHITQHYKVRIKGKVE